jgi:hypothetical protein
MGQPGDLLLIFADALIRSWKQITKYRSATSPASGTSPAAAGEAARSAGENSAAPASGIGGFMASGASPLITSPAPAREVARSADEGRVRKPSRQPSPVETGEGAGEHAAGELTEQLMPGVIRDERGVWIAPETED